MLTCPQAATSAAFSSCCSCCREQSPQQLSTTGRNGQSQATKWRHEGLTTEGEERGWWQQHSDQPSLIVMVFVTAPGSFKDWFKASSQHWLYTCPLLHTCKCSGRWVAQQLASCKQNFLPATLKIVYVLYYKWWLMIIYYEPPEHSHCNLQELSFCSEEFADFRLVPTKICSGAVIGEGGSFPSNDSNEFWFWWKLWIMVEETSRRQPQLLCIKPELCVSVSVPQWQGQLPFKWIRLYTCTHPLS